MPNQPEIYEDYRDQSVTTLFLLPSYQGDFRVLTLDSHRTSYIAPTFAASLFLTHERGLPLQELEAETVAGKYYIQKLKNDGQYGVLIPKCKFLYTKTVKFDTDMQIRANYVSSMEHTFCIADVTDSDMVSDRVIKRLLLSDNGENISCAAALSLSGDTILAKTAYLDTADKSLAHILASAIASRHFLRFGARYLKIRLGKTDFYFENDGDNIFATEPNPILMTLHAADFRQLY